VREVLTRPRVSPLAKSIAPSAASRPAADTALRGLGRRGDAVSIIRPPPAARRRFFLPRVRFFLPGPGFLTFFTLFFPKKAHFPVFFLFFFVFPLFFSSFRVIFTVRVFAFRQERSHITFGICCENEAAPPENGSARKRLPLRGLIG